MKLHEKYLNERRPGGYATSTESIIDAMNDMYVEWGGLLVSATDDMKKDSNIAKVQGLMAKADKAYEQFKKYMREAEKLAMKG